MNLKLSDQQISTLVSDVVKACSNIETLTHAAYQYLLLCNGIYAHYSQKDFIEYYRTHSLRDDILSNVNASQHVVVRKRNPNYEYYESRRVVYEQVVRILHLKNNN